jgi:tRNA A37 threonylcarbamoyladenosine dehydratase
MDDHTDYDRRFGGIARLYGRAALDRFARARVCVVGIGGVGSWAAEALARSAIGNLTLVDLDHVAESNMNRQIHALDATLGLAKVVAMAERIVQINRSCAVEQIEDFVEPDNLAVLLPPGKFDFVVDAIDSVKSKVALIAWCRKHGIALITVGSAGGQIDATRVRVADLAHTEHEPLLSRVRKRLRAQHDFPRNIKTKFGIDAVFSDEPLVYPPALKADAGYGGREGEEGEEGEADGQGDESVRRLTGLNCSGFGSTVAVTGVFGFVAAGHVLSRLATESRKLAPAATICSPGASRAVPILD